MISSVSNSSMSAWSMPRPDISKVASNLFSQLDTQKQGYLEASDLESAFSQISTDDSSSSSIANLFSQLDGDSDGKVTESEMTSGLQQLSEQLDAGFNNMRTQGMAGGMPPPPPPPSSEPDGGYTEEELISQLSEIGSTDSQTSSLISSVLSDFSGADANGDGQVSLQEAMSYQQSSSDSSTTFGSQSASSTSSADNVQSEVLRRMMQLMDAYSGYGSNSIVSDTSSLLSSLSVSV